MTATTPAPLLAALTAVPRKAAECVVLQARDGTVAGFTTWSDPVPVDLGLEGGAVSCAAGMNLSAVTKAVGFAASHFEIEGAAVGEFTRAKILGGRWRRAKVWLVRVSPGVAGYQPQMRGRVADGRIEGRRFILEVRNAADAFNQTQGGVLSPYCRVPFGGAECGIVRTPYAAEVTAVASAMVFTVDLAGDHADDFFNFGSAAFLTGGLGGTEEARVFDYAGTSGTVTLFEPMFQPAEVGDTLTLYRGCSKLLKSDDAAIPTCLTWENVINNRSHPEVPGSRTYMRTAELGSEYE